MDSKKKMLLAAGLGLVWVALALWQWETFKEPERAPLTNVSGVAGAGQPLKQRAAALRVNLELLDSARAQREATFTTPRNVFAVPREDGTLTVGNETVEAVEVMPVGASEEGQATTEPLQYRYLGFLRMGEGRRNTKAVAILSKDEEVLVVKVGDPFEGRLVLKTITPERVTIMDTAAQVEHTVPLSDEPPVQP